MSKELQDAKEQNRILIDKYIDVSMNAIRNLVNKIKELESQIKVLKEKSVKDTVSIPTENLNKKLYEDILKKIESVNTIIADIDKLSISGEIKVEFDKIKATFSLFQEQVKSINENTENVDYVKKINGIYDDIVKLNESLGKVRVFLRIKPLEAGKPQVSYEIKDEKSLVLTCDEKTSASGGPFHKIIDKDVLNGSDQFKKEIVKDITKELDVGKSLCLFGYGLSGSGKTYTMLGKDGILENIINIYKTIELEYVFEQYVKDFVVNDIGTEYNKLTSISGDIIDLKGNLKDIENIKEIKIGDEYTSINKYNINSFLTLITEYRKKQKRIKKTPNNNESSRSTLYLVFKIGDIHLVIVDCAGRESPEEIKNSLIQFATTAPRMSEILNYTKTSNLDNLIKGVAKKDVNTFETMTDLDKLKKKYEENKKLAQIITSENIDKMIKDLQNKKSNRANENTIEDYKKNRQNSIDNAVNSVNIDVSDLIKNEAFKGKLLNYLQSMFKEGYYINETLNHLIYFLNKKIDPKYESPDIQTCIEECELFPAPKKGSNKFYYDRTKIFKSPKEKTDVIKTMTIMKWIDNLCNPKYMMFCMIRQENDKCIDSAATLNFANSIKST